MVNLLSSELFRMRKRPQSWLLFAITVLLTSLIYGGFVIAARVNTGPDAASMRQTATFSEYDESGIGMSVGFFAGIMLIIVAAGLMGNEFSWNTLRPLAARARSRAGLLTAKLTALGLYAVVFVITLALVVAGMFFIGSWVVAEPSGFSLAILGDGLLEALRMLFANLPTIALAFMLATVFKSNAAGIAGALGVMFIEQPVFGLLRLASDSFESIERWGIAYNVNQVTGISGVAGDMTRNVAFVLAYGIAFIGIAYVVFLRRDITSG
jgi:ABC-2 type transport system permease protein